MTQMISPTARIGEVQLYVSSLERSLRFYQDKLGLNLMLQEGSQASLGVGGCRLVVLNEKPGAKPRPQSGPGSRTTGLYHFAVLLPDRRSLARLLVHIAESETEVSGAADHGVSESLYLADPDEIGIEFYCDRRQNEWPFDDLGRLQMGTDELDIYDLILELKGDIPPWTGLPEKTIIGHVHLQVAHLPEAEKFYTQALGFQLTQRYGSGASFVSTGSYHHQIGLNTWAGVGAPPPLPDATGLRWFEVLLPGKEALEAVMIRLKAAGVPFEEQEGKVLVKDPSQNQLVLKS
jgi:catechol 2,3-dioxygenase